VKIIHCADLHLDSPMASFPKEVAAKRKEELLLGFRRMVEYAVANNIKTILISGDLFDRKKPSATSINCVTGVIAGHPNIDFYYLKGNHDCAELYEDKDNLPDNLKLFTDCWTEYIVAAGEDGEGCPVAVYGIEPTAENKDILCEVPALDMNRFNIVMMHGDAGESGEISLRRMRGCGIDYLALGHIHSYKYEALDKRGFYCYPGCLEARGFDECGEHGFVVLDIDRYVKKQNAVLKNVSSRDMSKLMLDVSECVDFEDIFEKAKSLVNRSIKSFDDMFLLELVGNTDISCDKNIHMMEQYFNNNYFLAGVRDSSEYRVDYNEYALDESLKGEFVRMVSADSTLSEEHKAAIIRMGIRALRGEEIDV